MTDGPTNNMDMYTKHISSWAQKERVAGLRTRIIDDPVEQPDVTVEPGQEALTTDDINPPEEVQAEPEADTEQSEE